MEQTFLEEEIFFTTPIIQQTTPIDRRRKHYRNRKTKQQILKQSINNLKKIEEELELDSWILRDPSIFNHFLN
ncbi:hypothetical protein M0813_27450 [Anaeramoeba flamelloides]|uniref:Uncharacterized protein n=1 Tax=Anaeramoeba flamelloides TaxID=1746091 RepID=A0ABQ8XX00_9EUKA|nr:hypothetical protein M0813_27450 [Anaeramoeba flamelloides]